MAEPTNYDKLQDGRLDQLESLITAEYQPPAGVEYSFPVANQGITQEQFRLMFLGQANGMIHGDNGTVNDSPNSTGYRYYLEGHDSDSETNQRNTLILRAGTSAESIVEGFYHRLTEDMELPFPAVTTTTLYRVTLTYDPRKFKTSPVNIEVWNAEPPTAHGQIHLLLHTVERRPNQLLSQATITRYRQYTAGLVSVQNVSQLPDVDSVPAGTLAVPSSTEASGVYVRSNTSPKRWLNTMVGPWEDIPSYGGWDYSYRKYRHTVFGVEVIIRAQREESHGGNYHRAGLLPIKLIRSFTGPVFVNGGARHMTVQSDGEIQWSGGDITSGWVTGHFTIPDYLIAD